MSPSLPRPVIVVAPDSFKGSLDAEAVAGAIADGIRSVLPHAVIRACPMADGGEGSLEAIMHRGGERVPLQVHGASGIPRTITAGITLDGSAIVESADIVGITDTAGMSVPVAARSSAGLGEALAQLLDRGTSRCLIALGGTSTNDGGAGFLSALGIAMFDRDGERLSPTLANLTDIVRIDATALHPRLAQCHIIGMADVDNPLNGPRGATAVFGPQKGIAAPDVPRHDAAIEHFATLLEATLGTAHATSPGAGAAGGLGFAIRIAGGTLQSGADIIAEQIGLRAALEDADWLITGEGRSDAQTFSGKAPFAAAARARDVGVPATLLSGSLERSANAQLGQYFAGCFSIVDGPLSLASAIENTPLLLHNAAAQLTRLRFCSTFSGCL